MPRSIVTAAGRTGLEVPALGAALGGAAMAASMLGVDAAYPAGVVLSLAGAYAGVLLGGLTALLGAGRASARVRGGRGAAAALAAALALAELASWGIDGVEGLHLSGDVLTFVEGDALMIVRHALQQDPAGALGGTLAAAGLALLAWSAFHTATARIGRGWAGVSVLSFAAAWAILATGAALPGRFEHASWRGEVLEGDYVRRTAAESAPPALAAFAALTLGRPADPLAGRARAYPPRPEPLRTGSVAGDIALWRAEAAARGGGLDRDVVVVIVESMRADRLAAYGGGRRDGAVVMPTLERLAGQGSVFLDAVSTGSHTILADTPILSSALPLRAARLAPWPADPPWPRVMLYDLLKALGYETGYFSSQDEMYGGLINQWSTEGIDHFLHSRTFDGERYIPLERSKAGAFFANELAAQRPAGKIDDALTVDEAIRWIRGRRGRFFAALNLQNSHFPYRVPAGARRRFTERPAEVPLSFANWPRGMAPEMLAQYDDALSYVDDQIARLLRALDEAGRLDRTLVVVTSDHGEAFYEQGVAGHGGTLVGEVVRVPLVVYGPGVPAQRSPAPASNLDIPPTVLGRLGLPPFSGWQGLDAFGPVPERRWRFVVSQGPYADQAEILEGHTGVVVDRRWGRVEGGASAAEAERLVDALATWWSDQLGYYADPHAMASFYPPKPRTGALLVPPRLGGPPGGEGRP